MKKMFLLFSHGLTQSQIEDAQENLGVSTFVELSPQLQELWSQVPPSLESLGDHLKPCYDFLSAQAREGDYVLIQGDFGAVYETVSFAKKQGFIPIYATTLRKSQEEISGDTVNKSSVFEHVLFRKY